MNNLTLDNLKNKTESLPRANELDFLQVKKSPVQGLGLFTSQAIPALKTLFKIGGRKVHRIYDPAFSDLDPNWFGIGYQEWLVIDEGDTSVFINHSCYPNTIVNQNLELITLRPIEKNEELFLDYSATELDPYWSMKCNCGEPSCRKTLLSFQYLPVELQKKYSRFLGPDFNQ